MYERTNWSMHWRAYAGSTHPAFSPTDTGQALSVVNHKAARAGALTWSAQDTPDIRTQEEAEAHSQVKVQH